MAEFMKFKHPSGHLVSIGACHRDPVDLAAPQYSAKRWEADGLPPFVDLRGHLTPVEDQGHVGSCTANALAGAYEYLEKRTTGAEGRVSRLFVYWNERDLKGQTDQDCGANLGLGIQTLQEHGACSEDTWPYDPDQVFTAPADEAYEEAKDHTIDEAHRVQIELHDMRHCLAEGYPFVFGLNLFDTFEADGHRGGGRIRAPRPGAKGCGGHAMLCVGYSDKDKVFLIRNSWGEGWGEKGYAYIPYAYLGDPKYSHDLWTLRRAHNLDFTEGVSKDEESSFYEEDDPQIQVPAGEEEEQPAAEEPEAEPVAEDQPVAEDEPPAEEQEQPIEQEQPAPQRQASGQDVIKDLEELGKELGELGGALRGLFGK